MIFLKNSVDLEKMKLSCQISAQALQLAGKVISAGVTTKEVDEAVYDFIIKQGAKPSFLGYGGFPASICISINDEVIHGIPSRKRIIQDGDVVSVDVGAYINGFHGDNAYTYKVGKVSEDADKLLKITEESLYEGIKQAKKGNRIGDISYAIENHVCNHGYGVVKEFIGHGVGKNLHEEPDVPNFGKQGKGPRLLPGMTLAIEPMINLIGDEIKILDDKWTVITQSGSISAHFEHTIVITEDEPIILTKA